MYIKGVKKPRSDTRKKTENDKVDECLPVFGGIAEAYVTIAGVISVEPESTVYYHRHYK
jgi:hypothetical protein